jgi:hypothetical protein
MNLEEFIEALRKEGIEAPPEKVERLKAKYRDLEGIDKLVEEASDEG